MFVVKGLKGANLDTMETFLELHAAAQRTRTVPEGCSNCSIHPKNPSAPEL